MKYYLLDGEFLGKRPEDVPDFESLKEDHNSYWVGYFQSGKVFVAGPKLDGSGILVMKFEDDVDVNKVCDNDPLALAGVMRYKVSEFKLFSCIEEGRYFFE